MNTNNLLSDLAETGTYYKLSVTTMDTQSTTGVAVQPLDIAYGRPVLPKLNSTLEYNLNTRDYVIDYEISYTVTCEHDPLTDYTWII